MKDEIKKFEDAKSGEWYLEPDRDYEYRIKTYIREILSKFKSVKSHADNLCDSRERGKKIVETEKALQEIRDQVNPLMMRDEIAAELENIECTFAEVKKMHEDLSAYAARLSEISSFAYERLVEEFKKLNFNHGDKDD